jgi:hypothetical protein
VSGYALKMNILVSALPRLTLFSLSLIVLL